MKTKSNQPFILLLVFGLLSGCGAGGDWPNLSDKIPAPTDRNRVVEHAEPSQTQRPVDVAPITNSEAQGLMAEIITAANEREAEYRMILKHFSEYQHTPPAPDDTTHLWLQAQMALTRFSQTISRFNTILDSTLPLNNPVRLKAAAEKARLDETIVTERTTLAKINPSSAP